MKLFFTLFLAILFSSGTAVYAQIEDSTAPPSEVPLAAEVAVTPSVQAAVKAAAAVKKVASTDTIKGNGRNEVALVAGSGSCASGLKSTAVTNKSATKLMMVRVDVMVAFSGKMSKKSVLIDNLSPGETRVIGCAGCIDNQSGKTCTTYKIIAAAFK